MAATKKAVAVEETGINFGDLGMYAAGGGLPEGDYVWSDLTIQMFSGFAATSKGPARLGVMITLYPLGEVSPEAKKQQFYSFGSQADKSFAPNPDTGKGLVAVPGGPGTTLNNQTNWAILLKSLYDSGLPQGIFINDVSTLEGVHVHMMNVPEPAERSGFASKTGEAAEERKPGTIAIVSEIKDDGKPWEGTGGMEAKKGPVVVNKGKATAAKAKPEPEPEETGDEDSFTAATNGMSAVLEKHPQGISKLILRTGTFKAISAAEGPDMAQAVLSTYFATDEALNSVLSGLGYVASGSNVKPV